MTPPPDTLLRQLFALVAFSLISHLSIAADLPTVAGGLVPKGAEKNLEPWLELASGNEEDAAECDAPSNRQWGGHGGIHK